MTGHETIIAELQGFKDRDALGHGYIFFGPSMVGKRTTAIALGNMLEAGVFESPSDTVVLQDIKIIDINSMKALNADASSESIGIDAVREIRGFLFQRPNVSSRRTLIIDNAELLTTEAQNALLKITEEPPASALLILITSDIESILPTIMSRLPNIYFGSVAQKDIENWLIKDLGVAKTKAVTLAKRSLGKPGLAWRLEHDPILQKNLEFAEQFLKTSLPTRKEFIKKLIDPDDFSLRQFLDAVILTLAWQKPSKINAEFWHKTLKLYAGANDFSLNPRLQLDALMK